MKKISVIGATLLGAAVLVATPVSLHQYRDTGLSLSVDKAQAVIGRPLTPGSVAGVHRRAHGVHTGMDTTTELPTIARSGGVKKGGQLRPPFLLAVALPRSGINSHRLIRSTRRREVWAEPRGQAPSRSSR